MVPPEAFSTSAPQSSIAFCSGCVGGTQCDSLSSTVLSSAEAAPAASTSPRNTAPQRISIRRIVSSRYCDWFHFELFPFKRKSLGVYRTARALERDASSRSKSLVEHDLVGKPVPTFPDPALSFVRW